MKKSLSKSAPNGEFKGLGSRAWNVLQINRLTDIYLFTEHYKREGNFLSLRQCGPKLNNELTAFCLNLLNKHDAPVAPKPQNLMQASAMVKELANGGEVEIIADTQVEAIRSIESDFLQLSERSRNMLIRNGIIGPEQAVEYFDKHGTFLDLNHCGEATEGELVAFCKGILRAEVKEL
ncbi:MAG: hypothetical protein LAT84_03125 [Balneolia bacterium]|nr:hypothetical protein [Balneolia bacterium]